MGQRRLSDTQADDLSKRPTSGQPKKRSNIAALNGTSTRKGEVFRAQRRTSENVNLRASQHMIDIPVNKSLYNGYDGRQFSLAEWKRQPKTQGPKLKIMPIGGLGEMGIGKNMMAIEYDDEIIIIDCGFLFPGADYPGINYITPDITYLLENKHKIRAQVFTHGHLDHIGAYRHVAHQLPAPVYGSKFTLAMVKRTMEEATSGYEPQYNEMDPESHERIQIGDNFSIELVRVNHSIPDATAVVVRTPLGVLIDTGDWRFEEKPVDGKEFDLARLTEIASKEGILMLMNESTNCESEGTHSHGEPEIQASMGQIMEKYPNNRLIISSFSSQLHRMQGILDEAKKQGRKVAFAGYSMIQNVEVALRTGTIKIPKDVVVKMEDIIKLPDGKVTIVCTGSQGEFNAVLNRMASGAHKHIKIKNTDVVVFSSNPIPGNEKYVVRTVDGLMREGSDVIQSGKSHLTGVGPLHVSGHGYYDDHVKLINALNPTYYMPIHGEFHMLVHNAELAEKECAIPRSNIFVCDSGDVIEITAETARKNGRIPVGGNMYDDSGAIVSEVVLKDRIHMSQEGMFVVVLTVHKGSGRLLTSPDIISRGFIYLRDSEELMNLIRQYLKQKVQRSFGGRRGDMDSLKKEIKDEITHLLYDQTRRTPIVIPVINEIGGGNGGSNGGQNGGNNQNGGRGRQQDARRQDNRQDNRPSRDSNGASAEAKTFAAPQPRSFPPKQVPDTEVVEPRSKPDTRGY
ncbi:MAG: Beta-lactamase domain protein [Candidatus Saccharibacteria bacterium GW2011_GWC2_48_9]|nr:MAG: Beta-lactamase domain protein [Candidatus Saccharibacteria bacterium GW2011_GWC2_48_9]HCH34433.1 serine hydrolase [Candidatus Saccharibacteria bacterium]